LSQEEFAERFRIPLGTLRDWEQGRKDPDAAARAYLVVIGRNPAAVSAALHPVESRESSPRGKKFSALFEGLRMRVRRGRHDLGRIAWFIDVENAKGRTLFHNSRRISHRANGRPP
jgi:hypothetical protein